LKTLDRFSKGHRIHWKFYLVGLGIPEYFFRDGSFQDVLSLYRFPHIGQNIGANPHIWGARSAHSALHRIHSKFLKIYGKFPNYFNSELTANKKKKQEEMEKMYFGLEKS